MLKSRLIRKQDAELHFAVMAYLIRHFGAPPRPAVPSPLHKTPGLEKLSWKDLDGRSVFHWAEDHFGVIKSACNMNAYALELCPVGDGLDSHQLAANHRIDALLAGRMPYGQSAPKPIFYDPRDCVEPGHFTSAVVLQLAELRLCGFKPDLPLSTLMQRMATLTAAVYNRQGFVLANLPMQVSAYLTTADDRRVVPHRVGLNSLCFAACLALRVRRQSPEQIIGTYGTRMPNPLRKKIRQACQQIDSHEEALAVLQMLSEEKGEHRGLSLSLRRSA